MPEPEVKVTFQAISDTVAHYDSEFDRILSPYEVYEDKEATIRGRIDQVKLELDSVPALEKWQLLEEAVELGKQLKELEMNHKASAQKDDKTYHGALRAAMDNLCLDLVRIIGPARIQASLRALTYRERPQNPRATLELPAPTTRESAAAERPRPVQLHESDSEGDNVVNAQTGKRRSNLPGPSTRHKRLRIQKATPQDNSAETAVSSSIARKLRKRRGRTQTRQRHRRLGESTRHGDFEGVADPDPGEVYLAFWEKSKEWLAVLVLPLQNLQDAGISGSIESLGLAEVVPACYDYDSIAGSFAWQIEYGDGERLVTEREFPVMYFDGQDFPAKSAVGWVAAKDLRPFDANQRNSLVPHIRSVRKFLKARAAKMLEEEETNEPEDAGGGSPNVERQSRGSHSLVADQAQEATERLTTMQIPEHRLHYNTRSDPDSDIHANPRHDSLPRSLPGLQLDVTTCPHLITHSNSHPAPHWAPVPDSLPQPQSYSQSSPQHHLHTTSHADPQTNLHSNSHIEPHPEPRPDPQSEPQPNSQSEHQPTPQSEHETRPQLDTRPSISSQSASLPRVADQVEPNQDANVEITSIASSDLEGKDNETSNTARIELPTKSTQIRNEPEHQSVPPTTSKGRCATETGIMVYDAVSMVSEASRIAQAALDAPCPPAAIQQGESFSTGHENHVLPDSAQRRNEAVISSVPSEPSAAQPVSAGNTPAVAFRSPNAEALALATVQGPPWSNALPSPRAEVRPATHSSIGHGSSQDNHMSPELLTSSSAFQFPSLNLTEAPTTSTASLTLPPISYMMGPASTPQAPPARQPANGTDIPGTTAFPSRYRYQILLPAPKPPVPQQPANSRPRFTDSPNVSYWPYKLPDDLIEHLEEHYLRREHRHLGLTRLRNSSCLYSCPFCEEARRKYYKKPGAFANHLRQHWHDLKKNQV